MTSSGRRAGAVNAQHTNATDDARRLSRIFQRARDKGRAWRESGTYPTACHPLHRCATALRTHCGRASHSALFCAFARASRPARSTWRRSIQHAYLCGRAVLCRITPRRITVQTRMPRPQEQDLGYRSLPAIARSSYPACAASGSPISGQTSLSRGGAVHWPR